MATSCNLRCEYADTCEAVDQCGGVDSGCCLRACRRDRRIASRQEVIRSHNVAADAAEQIPVF